MIHLDTNIFIYFANGILNPTIVGTHELGHSSIVAIELLGYYNISPLEEKAITTGLMRSKEITLSPSIIERAISVRQTRRISLGDAVVAASALEYGAELWTANARDFQDIEGLKVYNPLQNP